jgi:hypothetical protein
MTNRNKKPSNLIIKGGGVTVYITPTGDGNTSIVAEVEEGKEEEVRQKIIKSLGLPKQSRINLCLLALVEEVINKIKPGVEILDIKGV